MVLCLIVGCGKKTGKIRPTTEKVSLFRVPRVVVNQEEYVEELTAERRRRWISAISRENLTDSILENDQVCSKHFALGEPAEHWDRVNVDWFPTLCLGHSSTNFGHSKQQVKDPQAAEISVSKSCRKTETSI